MVFIDLHEFFWQVMKRRFSDSPSSPPPLRLQWNGEEGTKVDPNTDFHCNEEMPELAGKEEDHNVPKNLKRRRVLPPIFQTGPPLPLLPEDDTCAETDNEFDSEYEDLVRARMAAQILFGDLEDRAAENLRENADYYEGDTPHTSQESQLSDYNWSAREGGDFMPLDAVMQFIWKYLDRPQIFSRVRPLLHLDEEMFEQDRDRVKGLVAELLNCEPVLLLKTLEDAIVAAENLLHDDGEVSGEEGEIEHLADY
jgi:hypothetical protein